MSRYVDIDALTRDVLTSVEEEPRIKVASDSDVTLRTEIGNAIKQAANSIRTYEDSAVRPEDLMAVVEGAHKYATSLEQASRVGTGAIIGGAAGSVLGPIGAAGGAYLGGKAGNALHGMTQGAQTLNAVNSMAQPGAAPAKQQQTRTASVLGNELRKLANQIRTQGQVGEEIRLTKAAQMLTAAVGLEHLTEGLK